MSPRARLRSVLPSIFGALVLAGCARILDLDVLPAKTEGQVDAGQRVDAPAPVCSLGNPRPCDGSCPHQLCDDFDGTTKWPAGWTPFDRTPGAFTARRTEFDATTYALELAGKGASGGYAFPTQKFKRSGADKRLRIRFKMLLKEPARVTVVELGDQDGPARLRIGVASDRPFVEGTDTQVSLPLPIGTLQPVELVVTAVAGATHLQIMTTGYSAAGLPALPEELEVRFGTTPLGADPQLEKPTIMIIDDVIIE